MDANSFLLQQEQSRVESQIRSALMQIGQAEKCADAVRHLHITVRSPFQSMKSFFGVNRFEVRAEEIVRQIVLKQIEEFEKSTAEDRDLMQGKLLSDWQSLRGNFPRLLVFAEREMYRVKHKS